MGKRIRREILTLDKVWKTQEYCMYFKFFKPQDCGKRSAEGRRPFIQSFLHPERNVRIFHEIIQIPG